jgi:hypothetical protein
MQFFLIRFLWALTLVVSGLIFYLSWIPESRMQLVPWMPDFLAEKAGGFGGSVIRWFGGTPLA